MFSLSLSFLLAVKARSVRLENQTRRSYISSFNNIPKGAFMLISVELCSQLGEIYDLIEGELLRGF